MAGMRPPLFMDSNTYTPTESEKIVSFSSPPYYPGIDPDVLIFIQGQRMLPRSWLFPDKLVFGYGIAADGTIWGVIGSRDYYFAPIKTKSNALKKTNQ